MEKRDPTPRYGVREQATSSTAVELAMESLRLLGHAVVDSGLDGDALERLRSAFERVRTAYVREFGEERLRAIDEHNTIRCPLVYDPTFLDLASNPVILELCDRLLGPGYILNQQNGLVNPPRREAYNQAAYHRDLPYQHFVASRPLAINAVFCLDGFTAENGATLVIPASHKEEKFPSEAMIRECERALVAPAGSFLVLDCMSYHRGGVNATVRERRGVNHVYSIGLLRQQIDLPALLGPDFPADAFMRRFLGYDYRAGSSIEEYLASRERKSSR